MLTYLAIVSTATAAFLGAPVWTLLIGAAVLTLLSALEHRRIVTHATWDSLEMLSWTAWQSAGNAFLASGAAYVLGYVTKLCF
jgi:hypothetical protein